MVGLHKGDNEAFNIGTGVKTNVNMLFAGIKNAMEFKGDAAQGPFRPGDIPANYLNAGKAAKILKWKPAVSLKDGIKNTYEYFKNRA